MTERSPASAAPASAELVIAPASPAARRRVGWLIVVTFLLIAVLLSIAIGPDNIGLTTVLRGLFSGPGSPEHDIVHASRLPRTVLGLTVGTTLGVAGALIQALTRNPLADPGVLGVNAGAAFAVAISISVFGLTSVSSYVWFAFLGAVLVTLVVYLLGSAGRGGGTPARLTLAGVAIGAMLTGVTSGLTLLNPRAFDQFRYWAAGTLAGREFDITWRVLPFIGAGLLLAIVLAGSLNLLAMGDDLAQALGGNVNRTRVLGLFAVTLLCGAATAAVGPVGFIGLMVPHVARWVVGPDQRWILAYTLVGAPALLLLSDVLGRLVVRPDEMPVSIVTAFVGAPVLIALVRRRTASAL